MTHGSPAMVLAKTHASQEEAVGHCSHLGIEEREDVMLLARQHKGVREIARTIGRDRPAVSRELARARQIQERLGIPGCFCAPHHPWEKGTDGNTNGLLLGFLPKSRSLDGAADAEVNAAYAMLSCRPRKRLGWKCPQEVFCSQALRLLGKSARSEKRGEGLNAQSSCFFLPSFLSAFFCCFLR